MKDILWTAYLAVMLMFIYLSITSLIDSYTADFLYKEERKGHERGAIGIGAEIFSMLSCIMIAIWYMYFLN